MKSYLAYLLSQKRYQPWMLVLDVLSAIAGVALSYIIVQHYLITSDTHAGVISILAVGAFFIPILLVHMLLAMYVLKIAPNKKKTGEQP